MVASYFGGRMSAGSDDTLQSLRLLTLASLITGNVVFMTYRASLTSEMSVQRETMPFDSLKTFDESHFR